MKRVYNYKEVFPDVKDRLVVMLNKIDDINNICSGIVNKYSIKAPNIIMIGTNRFLEFRDYAVVHRYKDYEQAMPGFLHDILGLHSNTPIVLVINSEYSSSILEEFYKYCHEHDTEIIIVCEGECDHSLRLGASYIIKHNEKYFMSVSPTLYGIKNGRYPVFISDEEYGEIEDDLSELDKLLIRNKYSDNNELMDLIGSEIDIINKKLNVQG